MADRLAFDSWSPEGYSSDVRLWLIVDGRTIPLAQIGHDSIILREPAELPVCHGEIVMLVDGRERRWRLSLPQGAVPFDPEVPAEFV